MKVAITSRGDTLESPVDERFGRAAKFILFDTVSRKLSAVDNRQSIDAVQGAGLQAAETIVFLGAECLLTGHCGPKAFRALSAAGVRVYNGARGSAAEALKAFEEGRLVAATEADVEGHW